MRADAEGVSSSALRPQRFVAMYELLRFVGVDEAGFSKNSSFVSYGKPVSHWLVIRPVL